MRYVALSSSRPSVIAFCFLTLIAAFLVGPVSFAQTTSPTPTQSDSQALTLANQAILALTGGTPISDVTLTATATRGTGTAQQTGSATLKALGTSQGRVDASTTTQFREIRNDPNAADSYWYGPDGTWHTMSVHNSWTDAAWFFPALSALATSNNPGVVVTYIGQGTLGGTTVNHIRFSRSVTTTTSQSPAVTKLIAHLTTMDVYLDPTSYLPVAETFSMHPDNDASKDLPAQVMYSDYRNVNGVQVPFRIRKYLQGGLLLDITVSSAALNTGLTSADFTAK